MHDSVHMEGGEQLIGGEVEEYWERGLRVGKVNRRWGRAGR